MAETNGVSEAPKAAADEGTATDATVAADAGDKGDETCRAYPGSLALQYGVCGSLLLIVKNPYFGGFRPKTRGQLGSWYRTNRAMTCLLAAFLSCWGLLRAQLGGMVFKVSIRRSFKQQTQNPSFIEIETLGIALLGKFLGLVGLLL